MLLLGLLAELMLLAGMQMHIAAELIVRVVRLQL